MVQKTTGLYRLTQIPMLYDGFQRMLGGRRSRTKLVAEYIRPKSGDNVLDLGCGPASILPCLGKVSYVGIDLNGDHIEKARADHGAAGSFHAGDFASLQTDLKGTFDLVLCLGFLHHIDDRRVLELARLAREYLAPGGRFFAIDPVFADGQPKIARWLAANDSGRCVRTASAYRNLVAPAFGNCETHVRHDLLRVPYSHCISTATAT